jgi:hypothetical protein
MASTNTPNEEIIEKSDRSPVATSCLVIAAVALLGAMTIQVLEIAQYRKGVLLHKNRPNPGMLVARADIADFKKEVDGIITGVGDSAAVETDDEDEESDMEYEEEEDEEDEEYEEEEEEDA